jgi:hypothetical protein
MSPSEIAWLAESAGFSRSILAALHPTEQRALERSLPEEVRAYFAHLTSCRDCLRRATRHVTCSSCLHFRPNTMNPEAGIGTCGAIEAPRWPEPTRAPPLYPKAPRACPSWQPGGGP